MHMPSNHSAHAILGVLWCACRGPFGGYRFVIVPLSSQDYLNDCWLYWAVMAPECPNLYRLLRGDRKQHARSLAALALGRELVADMVTEAVAELRFAVLLVAAVGTEVERLTIIGALEALVHGKPELAVHMRAYCALLALLVLLAEVR